jgi:hypothetical protein
MRWSRRVGCGRHRPFAAPPATPTGTGEAL